MKMDKRVKLGWPFAEMLQEWKRALPSVIDGSDPQGKLSLSLHNTGRVGGRFTPQSCISIAAKEFGVTVEQIVGASRKPELSRARDAAAYIAVLLTGMTEVRLCEYFNRERSFVNNAKCRCRNRMKDYGYNMRIDRMVSDVRSSV